jgi:hypothetical protein
MQLFNIYPTTRFLWLAYAFVALGFLPAIGFYYVGEEAIFPIVSLEMWQHGEWLRQLLYGNDLQHNPLFNWLIIPVASLIGWEYMLEIARVITIAATLLTGLVAAWLAQRIFKDSRFAAFAALTYLTLGDVLIHHGWLAYVDDLFGLFVFAAIAALWVACLENSQKWLAIAGVSLTCAFLAKAFTAYAFYGVAGLVLLARYWRFLLSPRSLLLHGATLAAPFIWLALLPGEHSSQGQGGRMFAEIVDKLAAGNWLDYAVKLISYPTETFFQLVPSAGIAIYLLVRRRVNQPEPFAEHFQTLLWITVINYLPYWLAPQSAIRYLVPIYPLVAIILARMIWRGGDSGVTLALRWIGGFAVLKLVLVLWVYPYYQSHFYGEAYATTAADIQRRTVGYPLYATDSSASGLSVTAYLDTLRLPAPALAFPPANWDSGFVLSYTANPALGQVYHRYVLRRNDLYLLCRGAACNAHN